MTGDPARRRWQSRQQPAVPVRGEDSPLPPWSAHSSRPRGPCAQGLSVSKGPRQPWLLLSVRSKVSFLGRDTHSCPGTLCTRRESGFVRLEHRCAGSQALGGETAEAVQCPSSVLITKGLPIQTGGMEATALEDILERSRRLILRLTWEIVWGCLPSFRPEQYTAACVQGAGEAPQRSAGAARTAVPVSVRQARTARGTGGRCGGRALSATPPRRGRACAPHATLTRAGAAGPDGTVSGTRARHPSSVRKPRACVGWGVLT